MSNQMFANRRGVTLLEVMFSIGIVLFGLMGIAAILPFAERQARGAATLDAGMAHAQRVQQQVQALGYLDPQSWIVVNDVPAIPPRLNGGTWDTSGGPTLSTLRYMRPQEMIESFGQLGEPAVFTGGPSLVPGGACLDPTFVCLATNTVDVPAPNYFEVTQLPSAMSPAGNGYRRGVFPYYKEHYNPYTNPTELVTGGTRWPVLPRLLRAAGEIPRRQLSGVVPSDVILPSQSIIGDRGVVADDALALQFPGDQTKNVNQVFNRYANPAVTNPLVASRQSQADFSSIVTVNVRPGSAEAIATVVAIHKRTAFPSTWRTVEPPSTDPKRVPRAERLAHVSGWFPATGFIGGAGGTVVFTSSAAVSPDVRVGQWIMLSRFNSGAGNVVFHRWYRVVSTGPVVLGPQIDPFTGSSFACWQRRVSLEGPDWTFAAVGNVQEATTATIVDGAVAATEFAIRLERPF
jgi:hypothetical protein